ncbi:MAG TPA: Stp1/IreP family PP2C-type Ser/Thr phosphatase [Pyrinomonadaceae bacterium]|nr:Stp1/IreP family PP2C-type Ser/Thr phosphatase [Pyrinomonadaceae bacterium]
MFNQAGQAGALSAGFELTTSVQTDVGCVREANEDSGLLVRPNDSRLLDDRGVLLVVADGMGGHASGEVASQMAVAEVSRLYYQLAGTPRGALKGAVEEANRLIHAASEADPSRAGMGTTCTTLAVVGNTVYVAHVGDSRCYRLRDGRLEQLTEDDSAVNEMVKLGIINRDEARTHEDKNVILKALGTTPEVEAAALEPFPARVGDLYLLCSDGLTDMVEDALIEQTLLAAADVHAAAEQLVRMAREAGGHDNITVGLVGVVPAGTAAAEAANAPTTREVEALI